MKKFLLFFVLVAIAAGCERVDVDLPEDKNITENESGLIMEAGRYRSNVGSIQVEKDVATGLNVESKDSANKIVEATWTIGTKTYSGLKIFHKFTSLGETEVNIYAKFADNKTENRTVKIEVINDLSATGPLVIKSVKKTDGSYDLWFGWDKRWLRGYTDTIWAVNGNITKWTLTKIPNQSYILDSSGEPKITGDMGKYLGILVNLKEAGLYTICLVAKNGDWIDITGSSYTKTSEVGLAYFQLNTDGSIVPRGDANPPTNVNEFPGDSGDAYFSFNQTSNTLGMTSLFFRLDSAWTNKSFAVKEGLGGQYGEPMILSAVTNFPNWGKLDIPIASLTGEVSSWRYGDNIGTPLKYSENMKKSVFYDDYLQKIRLFLVQIQAVKKHGS